VATNSATSVDPAGPRPATLDVRCPACLGSGRPLRLVVRRQCRLVRCRQCRTEFFRPDPRLFPRTVNAPISEYWEAYKFDIYTNQAVQHDYEKRYRATMSEAERLAGPIRSVLDVGCGIGNFVAFAEAQGITAYGIDVDGGAVAAARARGLQVSQSDDLDQLVADRSVDAVTLWDVIEHLYDPESVVRQVLRKLKPRGTLLLETPDAAFPARHVALSAYSASGGMLNLTRRLYYWEHKIYFTEAGLRRILGRAGCEIVSVKHETSPRAKMQALFTRDAHKSPARWLVARLWPLMERSTRRVGRGNKLIVVAVKSAADSDDDQRGGTSRL
jgi:2-polyprenyl-3-methyl-5-hydroxy-6-metoxy-1,4-benzoquinol methylase